MRKDIFHIILYLFIYIAILSCSGKKYITEIPYYYSDQYSHKSRNLANDIGSPHSIEGNNPQILDDDVLKIKEKYSIIMEVMPREITDYRLYSYIDEWLGTPYKKQSLEKQKAVDASYLIQALFSEVYEETFPKTPDGIFRSKMLQLFTGRMFLKEGDIIFFRYDKSHPISDVGLYLHNDRILACTSKGLNIYNFNDEYFQLRFVAAGRLKDKK